MLGTPLIVLLLAALYSNLSLEMALLQLNPPDVLHLLSLYLQTLLHHLLLHPPAVLHLLHLYLQPLLHHLHHPLPPAASLHSKSPAPSVVCAAGSSD